MTGHPEVAAESLLRRRQSNLTSYSCLTA